jgi:hypothetical protein
VRNVNQLVKRFYTIGCAKLTKMLDANLTVVDSHSSLTLPGALGSKVYNQVVSVDPSQSIRRIAATATTTRQELLIKHTQKGTGFNARIRTEVRVDYKKLDQDTTLTGGVVPSESIYLVIDRPLQSGGAITDTVTKNNVGACLDVVLTSGALDKLLNLEN